MTTLTFLLNLAGATMLLLFAVRMVQTGIERSMGPSFKRIVTERKNSRVQTAIAGVMLAIVLQSATAAALLVAGFTASGLLTFVGGLSAVLGADLGSALVIQVLTFQLDWLIPVLLATGGYLFLKTEGQTPRQIGRIILGIAFILLALRLLSQAVDPIRDGAFMPAIASYLEADFVTAFLVGAAVSFVMHSSVAAILMLVTFVSIGVLPLLAGVSLVMGANLGSASLMIWLSRGMPVAARRVLYGNLIPRGLGAIVALFLLNYTPFLKLFAGFSDGQTLVFTHLSFNAALVLLALPIAGFLEEPLRRIIRDNADTTGDSDAYQPVCALDLRVQDTPRLALGSLTREVLRMSQIVEVMVRPVMELYASGDSEQIQKIIELDHGVNQALNDIRHYSAQIPRARMSKAEYRRIRDLTEYSINLEAAGDIVSKRLLPLAEKVAARNLRFSKPGWQELSSLHERLLANMTLSFTVMVSEDVESARLLMEEKTAMAAKERKSRKRHLKRLRDGTEHSFESSDMHLETLRELKDLNSQFTAVAYPILYRNGQMLDTRLLDNLADKEDK